MLREIKERLGSNNNQTMIYRFAVLIKWLLYRWRRVFYKISLALFGSLSSKYLSGSMLRVWHFEQPMCVNPADVKGRVINLPQKKSMVRGGDWDIHTGTISRPIVEEIMSGLKYTDTPTYDSYLSAIKKFDYKSAKGLRSKKQLDDYFERKVSMIDDVKLGNFRTAKECGHFLTDEVTVLVGRYGDIILGEAGVHRLVAAKKAGIQSIPVFLSCIHEEFWCELSKDYPQMHLEQIVENFTKLRVRKD